MNGGVKEEAGNGMRKEGKSAAKSTGEDKHDYDQIIRGGSSPPLFQPAKP
jgi:hypothetical protein